MHLNANQCNADQRNTKPKGKRSNARQSHAQESRMQRDAKGNKGEEKGKNLEGAPQCYQMEVKEAVLSVSVKIATNYLTFWYFQFSQKMNEKIRLYYYGTSSRIVFVRLLGELKTPKRHYEIN